MSKSLLNVPPAAPEAPAAPITPEAPAVPSVVIPNDWKNAIPEEFRADPSLEAISDFNSLVKSYVNAQKMIGADKFSIPSKHDDGTQLREVFHKLGLPKDAKAYDVKIEAEVNPELLDAFKNKAFELGILPKQAEGVFSELYNKFNEINTQMANEYNTEMLNKQNSLKQEWGDGFDSKIALANSAVKYLTGEDQNMLNDILSPEISGHPSVVKLLAKVGEMLKEDDLVPDAKGQWGKTPEEVQTEINSIMSNPSHPYNISGHPNHEKAVQEVYALYKKLG